MLQAEVRENFKQSDLIDDSSILELTYFTPELAAQYGHPDIYGFLADNRPERQSEFFVFNGLVAPEPVDSNFSCDCAPHVYSDYCEHFFPGYYSFVYCI